MRPYAHRFVALAPAVIALLLAACSDQPATSQSASTPVAAPSAADTPRGPVAELSAPVRAVPAEAGGLVETRATAGPAGHEAIPRYSEYVLGMQEIPGVVSWKTLAKVQLAADAKAVAPKFDPEITKLNGQSVKVQGFMMPIEAGETHRRFILSALPPSCSFCLPGGAESIIEVIASEAFRPTIDPIVLSGKLQVLKSDSMGIFYRLTDARSAKAG